MNEPKYCPLLKEIAKCARWCAWYDEAEQQCAVMNIAAELVAMGEVVQYTITEKGREYLKGVGENEHYR